LRVGNGSSLPSVDRRAKPPNNVRLHAAKSHPSTGKRNPTGNRFYALFTEWASLEAKAAWQFCGLGPTDFAFTGQSSFHANNGDYQGAGHAEAFQRNSHGDGDPAGGARGSGRSGQQFSPGLASARPRARRLVHGPAGRPER